MSPSRFEYDNLIFKGRVIEVHSVGVRMPDGRVLPRDYVHYSDAVVVLPVLDDGRIVLIRNKRFAVEEELIELTAGMVDAGEEPLHAAGRELAEETGYTAGRIESLGWFYTGPGSMDERIHAFLATGLREGPQHLETYEEIRVQPLAEDEVRRMVLDGTIHDAKTIAALGLYWLRQRGG
jgi:ADP-ribose pyrophosphatase